MIYSFQDIIDFEIVAQKRLGPRYKICWEQRKTPAKNERKIITPDLKDNDFSRDLKLTLIGLGSRILPDWPRKQI